MSPSVHSSASPLSTLPEMPDNAFAWFSVCCNLMGKSPMFMVLLIDHQHQGFCWMCAFIEGLTPREAVVAYQHVTSRRSPEDTSRDRYHLFVQTDYGRA